MDWIQNNWIWLAVAGGMIAMHFLGHGGHRHGRKNPEPGTGGKNVTDPAQDNSQAHTVDGLATPAAPSKQHRHGC